MSRARKQSGGLFSRRLACREARGGRASEGLARALGTAGVPDCQSGSQDGPLRGASRAPDTVLRDRLRKLANEGRRFGYRRLFVLLRREGEPSGIYRPYREDGGGSGNGPGDRFPDDTDSAQAEGPTQSDRHAGPDPARGATQGTLVAGMRRIRKQSGGLFSRRMGMTSLPTANASGFSTWSTTSPGNASRRSRTLRYPDGASHESYRP